MLGMLSRLRSSGVLIKICPENLEINHLCGKYEPIKNYINI